MFYLDYTRAGSSRNDASSRDAPQQMAQQPMMAPPTQMPSGQPIAQATPMPPQPGMMAFGGPAELDKFVYDDGGLYRAQNGDGGKKKSERDYDC